MFSFILLIALVVVWIKFDRRIERLEMLLRQRGNAPTEQVPVPRPMPTAETAFTRRLSEEEISEYGPTMYEPSGPSAISRFIDWVKKDFMVKLGAFLLLLAFGWFVSYAIMEEWIGPAGQIALGLLAGVFFLGLGVWRIESYRHQGGIFTVLGASIVLFTLFAAREIYDMFTPASALFVMFMAVVFVAFVSVRYQSEKLAHAGLLLGSAAPLFTGVLADAPTHFMYLLIVALGSLWVVWNTGWTRLILVSLVVTYFYSVAFMIDGFRADRDVVLLFSFIFVSMYFAANMVSLVRRHVEGVKHMLTHTLVALGTAIFLFTWIEVAVDAEWKSILYVAWAMIFAVGTYIVYSFTANKPAFYLYGATAAALIGVATAAELDGPVLTLAYLFEICVLLLAAGRLGLRARTLSRMSLLLTVPVLLSLESFGSSAWRQGVFHEDFVVLGLTMFVLGTIGLLLHAKSAEAEDEVALITAQGHLAVSGLYATALVWLILHAAVASDDLATMLSLIIYTVVGIGLFVAGTARSIDWQRLVGSILIGFVVLRLLFVEVWDMNLEGRIITFLIIGVLLISTAFLHKNRKQTDDVIVSE